jgi:hypothetical protein
MTDVADNEKGYNSGSSDNESQHVFERPTGLKGVYYHPLTQVSTLTSAFQILLLNSRSSQVCLLGFVCFMCPGSYSSLMLSLSSISLRTVNFRSV